jgi:pimeloyl-ACP methyl ester carboxylesterase
VPAVFVHGVPDTFELWDPLLAEVARDDTITLRLPGFSAPVPDGFDCTKESYAGWVADQMREVGEPVDLVGHDWGAMLCQRVAVMHSDLVRTYTLVNGGVGGPIKWHDLALQWQTPEVGEQVMEMMTPELVEPVMRDAGHPDPAGCAAHVDDTMKAAILKLYRSAVDVGADWAPHGTLDRPGLVLWGRDDPFAKPKRGEEVAAALGTRCVVVDGGHWAIFDRPVETARLLEEHWA